MRHGNHTLAPRESAGVVVCDEAVGASGSVGAVRSVDPVGPVGPVGPVLAGCAGCTRGPGVALGAGRAGVALEALGAGGQGAAEVLGAQRAVLDLASAHGVGLDLSRAY